MLQLRKLTATDPEPIATAFADQGWNKPEAQYREYLRQQREGLRDVIVASWAGSFAGYLTIVWESQYAYFRDNKVPEIVDFNVLKKFQRRGVGTALMDEAERRIAERSAMVGIGVGITADYGPAQILYQKRRYLSLGHGLTRDGEPLHYGDRVTIDDSLVLHLQKIL
ncbi:GNAT family N-acetyltransferase [Lewinella sp. W8]|uniref:GNAT family N-acetyltransferase n=1 Tax=Lewinella sp. W8 TaxID=2528208 RepID=UPI0010679483|nr:GNAT family N-acetyltransferase [Lewinella sp. W8]MTB51334.1 GNAT family N-acetyltransferase [Lewinella sp. W8]